MTVRRSQGSLGLRLPGRIPWNEFKWEQSDRGKFYGTAEARDLGWKPGFAPDTLTVTTLSGDMEFTLSHHVRLAGTTDVVAYAYRLRGLSITVFND